MIELVGVDRSLAEAFAENARAHPDASVMVVSATRPSDVSLAQLHEQGLRFGAHLQRLGVGPGDVVAVQLPGWAEWLVAVIGIAHAGAVILPIVSIYGTKEVGFILRQSAAKMIITPDQWRKVDYAAMVAEIDNLDAPVLHVVVGGSSPAGTIAWDQMQAPIAPTQQASRTADDLAMLVYTSGTTADPKGVQHSARTLLSELQTNAPPEVDGPRAAGLSPWPPGHVAGATGLLRVLVEGGRLILMDQWDPVQAAMLIEKYQVGSCGFTPFHLTGLLDAADRDGRDISCLRRVVVGATTVPPALIDRCEARGMPTTRSYGSSEMPTVSRGDPEDPLEKRLTTEGRLLPGAEVRFVDDDDKDVEEGELLIRGPELFIGYFDEKLNGNAFLPGGWFRTGDIGRLDPDGYLQITDRKKDIIIRGGENISSREVEDLLTKHPSISEASAVAAPNERMGEVVCAFLVLKPGTSLALEDIREYFAQSGMAKQKTPEMLRVVADLPRNSTGKVLKHELRALLRDETVA